MWLNFQRQGSWDTDEWKPIIINLWLYIWFHNNFRIRDKLEHDSKYDRKIFA